MRTELLFTPENLCHDIQAYVGDYKLHFLHTSKAAAVQ